MMKSQSSLNMNPPSIRLPSDDSRDSVESNSRFSPSSSPSSTETSTPPDSPPPESNTHNTSRAKYHVKNIGEFASALEISANRALPNRGTTRYKSTKVLLLRWEEDPGGLGVEQELNALENVFQDYGFDTEIWLIPTECPGRKVMRRCLDFIDDYEDEDTLLTVYYGGHAAINQSQQATWSCAYDITYSSFEWNGCQRLFEDSRSDVLLLLDCCCAAAAATASSPARTESITEIIAACGWETWAPVPGLHSFTNALIAVLQDRQIPFSAAMLHSEVLSFLKQPRPRLRAAQARQHSKTPVYVLSASDPRKCSIEIARRTSPPSTNSSFSSNHQNAEDYTYNSPPMTPVDSASIDTSTFISTLPDHNFVLPHVIMSIALETDQDLDVRAFAQWLRQFPALAQYAKIQGVYRGYSTLVLAALPVVIWNLLPENPAYNFVGYARSDNLIHTRKIQKPVKRRSTKVSSGESATQDNFGSNPDFLRGEGTMAATKDQISDHGSKSKSRSKDNSSFQARRFTNGTDIFTQAIDRALKKSANIPAKNWALAVVLHNGTETTYTSQQLAPYRTRLFNSRFSHDFHRYVRGTDDLFPNSGYASDISSASTLVFGPSKYRTGSIDSRVTEPLDEDSDSAFSKHRSSSASAQQILATLTQSETHQPKDLSDSHQLETFYFARFSDLQQFACRQLARTFVKLIEPEKQLHYPYRNGSVAVPEWWPSTRGANGVRHKEPDHLLKTERITLLVHIIWIVARPKEKQPQAVQNSDLDITKLEAIAMESLESWFGDEEHPENILNKVILKEIFEVAKAEERFQRDEGEVTTKEGFEKNEILHHQEFKAPKLDMEDTVVERLDDQPPDPIHGC